MIHTVVCARLNACWCPTAESSSAVSTHSVFGECVNNVQGFMPVWVGMIIFCPPMWIFWLHGVYGIGCVCSVLILRVGVLVLTDPHLSQTNGCSALLGWTKRVTDGGPSWARCIFWWLSNVYAACISSVRNGKRWLERQRSALFPR